MGAMSGKTCIVTGGSSGIGLETVRGLAREGAHVVIAVRDVEKGRAAETDVLASVPGAKLTVMGIDISRASAPSARSSRPMRGGSSGSTCS
jgi:NAD(P)-dependent dehydrogenase (short-subunit alcohol dehydrogenase family)